jgi:hypothetical protein
MMCLPLNDFDIKCVLFGEKTKNNIIENSDYYNIHYSNVYFTSSNLSLHFHLESISVENYYNKYKCNFENSLNYTSNIDVINKIKNVEYDILNSFNTNKRKVYKLTDQLEKNVMKLFTNNNIGVSTICDINVVLKISGLWEDDNECGIIYKFVLV